MTRSALHLARRPLAALAVAALAVVILPALAHAAGAGGGAAMPWNTPLQNLLSALSGTTARLLIALALVVGGFTWAFSRSEEGMRRIGQTVVGGAIVIGAASIVTALGFVGATL